MFLLPGIKSISHKIIYSGLLTYSTVKIVRIPKTTIALLNRVLQSIVITFIAVYIIWYKKGYQQIEVPRGISIIKVKGLAKTTLNDTLYYNRTDNNPIKSK
ncbi:unnamed protein product [Didymodactylos carnosus]|uniref:Uncharacterized protein n=1 Tax=Didymodactylos carnosus TaxID=1234261 RepID=A0A8S2P9B3_9BILA|nr:unnamed protein product [Didymodactylos carnosus]CAF4041632.1 unnamed protein product [Didymodactylos carnosus]